MDTSPAKKMRHRRTVERDAFLQLLVEEFDRLYPTEAACVVALIGKFDEDEGKTCNHCGSHDIQMESGDRIGHCDSCGKPLRTTADTFFEGIRSARPYLFVIWLMENGISVNGCELHRTLGIASSTGSRIIKMLSLVINESMQEEPLAICELSEGFVPIFYKRSLETPANKHPMTEEAEMEKRALKNALGTQSTHSTTSSSASATSASVANAVSGGNLSRPEEAVLQVLSLQPVKLEKLSEQTNMPIGKLSSLLMMLELKGLIESLPGEQYKLLLSTAKCSLGAPTTQAGTPVLPNLSLTNIDAAIDFIRTDFRGISRKYLQLYLGVYWCYVDRARWSCGKLLRACRNFRSVTEADIRAFVTPLVVRLMPDRVEPGGPTAFAVPSG
jgi:hypothetical protein